jgi:hypothetical protein
MVSMESYQVLDELPLEITNDGYKTHPYYEYFRSMLKRAKKLGIPCDFTGCLELFNKWLEVIGSIPVGMKIPTVGRYDHKKGYVYDIEMNRWNFRWQPKSDNSREAALRTTPFKTMTPENLASAGRKSAMVQLEAGTHINQLGKAGCQTGVAQKAAIESLNHISKRFTTCPGCGVAKRGPMWKFHCNNLLCQ